MFTKKIVKGTDLREITDSGCNVKKHSLLFNLLKRSLKKATTVAGFIGIATGLFPAIAQAQLIPSTDFSFVSPVRTTADGNIFSSNFPTASGSFQQTTSEDPASDSYVLLKFSLNNTIGNDNKLNLDSQGEFPRAIENFSLVTNNENLNLSFLSATLRTSKLGIDPNTGNFPGLTFGYEPITDNNSPYATFNNDGTRYDFTFDNRSETLTLFLPSSVFTPSYYTERLETPNGEILREDRIPYVNLYTVFGNVIDAGGVQGVVKYPELGIEQRFLVTGNQRVFTQRSVNVPEPTAVATLLGIGAYGTVSLVKRNQRLKKTV